MSVELKIKLKSLAEEQRIIKKEERKRKGQWAYQVHNLRSHRVDYVRPIIRATHIAYGLIRGLTYEQIENSPKTSPDWGKVKDMLKKYGNKGDLEKLYEKSYIKSVA